MTLDELRDSRAAAISIAAVATLLHVDERTISRACAAGELPSLRLGRRILIPREPLLALLSAPSSEAS